MRKEVIFCVFVLASSVVCGQTLTVSTVCTIPGVVNESSGIEKTGPNTFWTHNDSGGNPELYKYDSSGTLLKTISVVNATNADWEDLAYDDNGTMFIGDFGNNGNSRSASNQPLRIYIVANPASITGTTTTAGIIEFEYEDRDFAAPSGNHNFDMEGFFFYDDSLHLFTKNRTNPTNGLIKHYKLPAQPGNYTAELVDSINNGGILITSADISPDKRTIALLANNRLFLVSCFQNSRFLETGVLQEFTIALSQKEAVVFIDNTHLFITDEYIGFGTGKMYRINPGPYIFPEPVVTQSQTDLTVSPASGYTYSWYLDGNLIPGATSSTYSYSQSGTYYAGISDGAGCVAYSEPQFYTFVSAEERYGAAPLVFYPNPSTGSITINGGASAMDWQVLDLSGRSVASGFGNTISGLTQGAYTVVVRVPGQIPAAGFILVKW
jgi:hypothetical protein